MPVLSDRSDVIVITDEAHRSQYDTLALNMRRALPNASFMGFTGTPLIAGEELTRQQFGDYVSIYNFRDAIEDGATVPLYYENRIPELQLVNEDFADELDAICWRRPSSTRTPRGSWPAGSASEYTLLTRPERLRRVAKDLVRALRRPRVRRQGDVRRASTRPRRYACTTYVQRGVGRASGRAARPARRAAGAGAAVAGQPHRADGDHRHGRRGLARARTRSPTLDKLGPRHPAAPRADEPTRTSPRSSRTADDPLRLVFVCAMWMTGFDAPSVSTIYLDRPMRNHTLMQTIARANRVFPDKDNGLIVDYVGVFRNLEKALAIYGAANAEPDVDSPIQDSRAARRGAGRGGRQRRSGSVRRYGRRPDRAAGCERASRTSRCATRRGGAAGR